MRTTPGQLPTTGLALVIFLVLRFLFGPGFDLVTAGGIVLILLISYLVFQRAPAPTSTGTDAGLIADPPLVTFLFNSVGSAGLWLAVRVYLGLEWFEAGWHKYSGGGWLDGGSSLKSYWERAVTVPASGRAPITYDWYRDFLQFMLDNGWYSWFAWIITFGEMFVGIGLIFGILVGFAAFFGALMNMSFMFAGSASSNPVLFTLAVAIMLAWKVAGWYGVDRYLLPMLGAPWMPGWLWKRTVPAG